MRKRNMPTNHCYKRTCIKDMERQRGSHRFFLPIVLSDRLFRGICLEQISLFMGILQESARVVPENWNQLEILIKKLISLIMLSEIRQTPKDKYYMTTYPCDT